MLKETEFKLEISRFNEKGSGIGIFEGRKYICDFSVPKDLIKVKSYYKKRKSYLIKDFEIIKASPYRINPICEHFGQAGGCQWQNIDYKFQLMFKKEVLDKIFDDDIKIIASPVTTGYRNRMDIVISTNGIGFRARGLWWKIIPTTSCVLYSVNMAKYLIELNSLKEEEKLSLYNFREQKGDLRYLVLREAKFTKDTQINLISNLLNKDLDLGKYFSASSIYLSENSSLSDISSGEIKKFWGEEYFKEKILNVEYLIHPDAFFQNNSYQFENILKEIGLAIKFEDVLDAYSGIGSIGIYLAKKGLKITGFDNNPFSIKMANINVLHNKTNAKYILHDDKISFENLNKFGSVVVDPPRSGLHKIFRDNLLNSNIKQIIYLSCNPKTLKQDIDILKEKYVVKSITGYDMFPHTPHIEVLVDLERK